MYLVCAGAVRGEENTSEAVSLADISCNKTVVGEVVFDYEWANSVTVPPGQMESGFNALMCVAHTQKFSLFENQRIMSRGVIDFLNKSDPSLLSEEIRSEAKGQATEPMLSENRQVVLPRGKDGIVFNHTPGLNFISCMAKFRPSPDWFVGVANVDMCTDGLFFNLLYESSLPAWDAGYDDMPGFSGPPDYREPPAEVTPLLARGDTFGSVMMRGPRSRLRTDDDKKDVCFPANAKVLLDSGNRVAMKDLSVGGRIATRNNKSFSPVYFFSHAYLDVNATFMKIAFIRQGEGKSGIGSLLASPSHYVYVVRRLSVPCKKASPQLVPARDISVGDMLVSESGVTASVVRTAAVTATGLFNPHTFDGDLIVDGVRVSCYTTTVHPPAATAALAPLRISFRIGIHSVANRLAVWLINVSRRLVPFSKQRRDLPGFGLHWVAQHTK